MGNISCPLSKAHVYGQVFATNKDPSSPTTSFLKVYNVSASAPTEGYAALMYGPLIVPAGGYGCPGGSNNAGSCTSLGLA